MRPTVAYTVAIPHFNVSVQIKDLHYAGSTYTVIYTVVIPHLVVASRIHQVISANGPRMSQSFCRQRSTQRMDLGERRKTDLGQRRAIPMVRVEAPFLEVQQKHTVNMADSVQSQGFLLQVDCPYSSSSYVRKTLES